MPWTLYCDSIYIRKKATTCIIQLASIISGSFPLRTHGITIVTVASTSTALSNAAQHQQQLRVTKIVGGFRQRILRRICLDSTQNMLNLIPNGTVSCAFVSHEVWRARRLYWSLLCAVPVGTCPLLLEIDVKVHEQRLTRCKAKNANFVKGPPYGTRKHDTSKNAL